MTKLLRALALAAATTLVSGAGWTLSLADVNPLFFPLGGVNTGFDPAAVAASGVPVSWQSTPASTFLCAGEGTFEATGACEGKTAYDIEVTLQDLQRPVDQNPQEGGIDPTPANPFIATSLWTIRNNTEISDPLALILTNIDLGPNQLLFGDPYPDIEAGFDANLLGILRHSVNGDEFFFGGIPLGVLGPGESVILPVRYVVNEALPFGIDQVPPEGPDLVTPPMRVIGFVVPEPTTALLLGAGLTALAASRRVRRCV